MTTVTPASRPASAPATGRRAFAPGLTLAAVELRMLLRRPGLASVAVLLPVVLIAMTYVGTRPEDAVEWGAMLGNFTLIVLLLTGYMNVTTILTSRRDQLVFKRLRTSEITAPGLIASVVLPLATLGLIQSVGLYAGSILADAPVPQHPGLLAVALLTAFPLAFALGAFTSAVTSSSERAQITVLPVFVGAALGGQLVTGPFNDLLVWSSFAFPLASTATLVQKAWGGTDAGITTLPLDVLPVVPAAIAVNLLWCAAAVVLAVRLWRWEPRA